MTDQARGRYRTITPAHGAQYAWVATGKAGGQDVPEREYREKGYQPPFEELPLKEDYEMAPLVPGSLD